MVLLDVAFYALIVVVLIQVFFFLHLFRKFAYFKENEINKNSETPVSVIICAKNEAENLKVFLPSVINQEYKDFQIVLINDASKDDTLSVMETFAASASNIKIVDVKQVESFWGNKKYPLTLGIKASEHDILLFTDADCKPLSKYWISEMVSRINQDTSIVLGYGAYAKIKGSFLNKLIRFETLTTAISYASMAIAGSPYMGVGRNLAYTKSQFFKINGFIKHINILSGDDDLFVNAAATAVNTTICFSQNAWTESMPKTTFKSWFKQKRRHVSTAKNYKLKHKIILFLLYTTNFLFWALSILLLVFWFAPIYVIGLILIRMVCQFFIFMACAKKLNENDVIPLFSILEIFLILFQLAIFITNLIKKPNHWK
ncbi:glycosyltransferase [Flavobacteriaceae bacterium MHTCC 0001]